MLIPFRNIYKAENTWEYFFAYTLPIYLKKASWGIWKSLGQFVSLYPFIIFKKKDTYESEKTYDSFFSHTFLKYLKKAYLQIWKYLWLFFCLYPFQIFTKSILTKSISLGHFVCLYLFKYLKKDTYESENTWYNFQIFEKAYLGIWKDLRQLLGS